MLNRILAVTALGLAVGLAACDQGGQEQAQNPNKSRDQQTQQSSPSAPQSSPSAPQSSPSAPSSAPSGSSSGGNQ